MATKERLFRATVTDAASGSNFVIEFLAPFPVEATVDYQQIALSKSARLRPTHYRVDDPAHSQPDH